MTTQPEQAVRPDIQNAALAVEMHDEMIRRGFPTMGPHVPWMQALEQCAPVQLPLWEQL